MKNEEIWSQTQNPRRFPGFTVVVVTFFVEILDEFHDFVSECVSFQKIINNPFWEVTVFFDEKWQFSLDVKQKHTFYQRESKKNKLAKVSFSNNNDSFRIINQSTTTLLNRNRNAHTVECTHVNPLHERI